MDAQAVGSLAQLHTGIRIRVGSALASVRFLTAAAPFCAPALELVETDLEAALDAAQRAEQLERQLTRLLAGPGSGPPAER
jgi:hypothetical protein